MFFVPIRRSRGIALFPALFSTRLFLSGSWILGIHQQETTALKRSQRRYQSTGQKRRRRNSGQHSTHHFQPNFPSVRNACAAAERGSWASSGIRKLAVFIVTSSIINIYKIRAKEGRKKHLEAELPGATLLTLTATYRTHPLPLIK